MLSNSLSNIYSDAFASFCMLLLLIYDVFFYKNILLGIASFISMIYSCYRAKQNEVTLVNSSLLIRNIFYLKKSYHIEQFTSIKKHPMLPGILKITFYDNSSYTFIPKLVNKNVLFNLSSIDDFISNWNKLLGHIQ